MNVPAVFVYVVPSILYVKPNPTGAVMVMVPVASVQLGWVLTVTVGAAEASKAPLTVTVVAADVRPLLLRTVTA